MADTINQNTTPTNPTQPKVEEVKVEETNKKEDKKDKKDKKEKKPRRPFKVVMKTWSKGLSKEASRVAWEKKHDVLKDFVTVFILCAIMSVIFFAIDMIIIAVQK